MKIAILVLFLSLSRVAQAESDPLVWLTQCTTQKTACWLEKRVRFIRDKGEEIGGVAVAYDNIKKEPIFITVLLPSDLIKGKDIVVKFANSVKENEEWQVKESSALISLPIMECSKESCSAKVYPEIKGGDGETINLFAKLKESNFLWVMFIRNNTPHTFLVPVSGINSALNSL